MDAQHRRAVGNRTRYGYILDGLVQYSVVLVVREGERAIGLVLVVPSEAISWHDAKGEYQQ